MDTEDGLKTRTHLMLFHRTFEGSCEECGSVKQKNIINLTKSKYVHTDMLLVYYGYGVGIFRSFAQPVLLYLLSDFTSDVCALRGAYPIKAGPVKR